MTDNRPFCLPCRTRMTIEANGIEIPYTQYTFQSGDKYRCPKCGHEIVVDFSPPYAQAIAKKPSNRKP